MFITKLIITEFTDKKYDLKHDSKLVTYERHLVGINILDSLDAESNTNSIEARKITNRRSRILDQKG